MLPGGIGRLVSVEVDIRPEPTSEERAAIIAALRALAAEADWDRVSPWWRQGLEESLDDDRPG